MKINRIFILVAAILTLCGLSTTITFADDEQVLIPEEAINIESADIDETTVSAEEVTLESISNTAPVISRIELSAASYTYTGEPIEPAVTVFGNDDEIISPEKYTVRYSENTNVGTASISISGTDEYAGQNISEQFSINPAEITDAVLKYSALNYTSAKRTQTNTTKVYCGERVLTKNRDYVITYKNNAAIGTATMTIKGVGNYTGSMDKKFKIVKAPLKKVSLKYTSKRWTGKALKPSVTVKAKLNGQLTALKKNTDYTVSYKNNIKVGTATVTVKGKGNFTGTIKKTFKITAIPMSALTPGDIVDASMIKGIESKYFKSQVINYGDGVYNYINGKSYYDNPNVKLSDLRYLKVLHYNFDHKIQVGEIIVNKSIANNVKKIFKELFDAEYEIYSMYLIDRFWTGDPDTSDSMSCHYNNTSSFCYRTATNSSTLSRHAYGMAIDINTQQNPYVWYENGVKTVYDSNSKAYIDRTWGDPHMIVPNDICWRTFVKYGFRWGGDWLNPIDYQHFEI